MNPADTTIESQDIPPEDCELIEVGKVTETAGGIFGGFFDCGNGLSWLPCRLT